MVRPAAKAPTPTLGRGMCKGSKTNGFTLIELLVVLAILGICASVVVTIVRPDERAAVALEAERLARLLELAALESRLTGSPITWVSDGTGYRFLRHVTAERSDPGSLRPRVLPAGMTITALRIESVRPSALRLDFAPYAPPPSFAMEVSSSVAYATVAGTPMGTVQVASHAGQGSLTRAPH